jgi:DNA replication protein DnaC
MEHISKALAKGNLLDETLSSMNHEYILTPEEEAVAIQHELNRVRSYYEWKMQHRGLDKKEIREKMKEGWVPDIDVEAIKQRANMLKHRQVEDMMVRQKEREEEERKRQGLKEFWTAGRFLQYLRLRSPEMRPKDKNGNPVPLIENEHTFPLIKVLCLFLSQDKRFETDLGLDLSKGLLIRGVSGLGKTHLVECLSPNELSPIRVLSMIEITDTLKDEGEYTIQMGNAKILYLDDVGTEETPVNYYGTKINWFKDFLELYYSKRRPFNQLMISTNLSSKLIEEKYGFRVRSRAKDMFNYINVTGEDLRGK